MISLPGFPAACLRPHRLTDAADFQRNADDAELAALCSENFPHPYTLELAEAFLAKKSAQTAPYKNLALVEHDHLIGTMGLISVVSSNSTYAEIGYWTGEAARGRGLTSAALTVFCDYVFAEFPQLYRLEAVTFAKNIASQRVLEKAGFTRECLLRQRARYHGQIVDDVLYARLREAQQADSSA